MGHYFLDIQYNCMGLVQAFMHTALAVCHSHSPFSKLVLSQGLRVAVRGLPERVPQGHQQSSAQTIPSQGGYAAFPQNHSFK